MSVTPVLISPDAARRIALAAQGFGLGATKAGGDPLEVPDRAKATSATDLRRVAALFERIGLIQVDSVNIIVRSQELPVLARLGPHPRNVLPHMLDHGRLFEYWAHEASLVPVELQPLLRWRMEEARTGEAWRGLVRFASEHPGYLEAVRAEVIERGPLKAGELTDPGTRNGPWWGWNNGKRALEYLFWCGFVTARRTSTFERVYDVPERLLPAAVLAAPTPVKADAQRALVARAARAMGIATIADLADYFRMRRPETRARVEELVEAAMLQPAVVPGWRDGAYLWVGAEAPRRVQASALLSPFDSLVWNRPRTERVFGFRYRIEIYTPASQRVYGYYVLPFLFGDRLLARVDLKADRQAGVLRALAIHREPAADMVDSVVTAPGLGRELARRLREMAAWLGLAAVEVSERGDLHADVRTALTHTLTR